MLGKGKYRRVAVIALVMVAVVAIAFVALRDSDDGETPEAVALTPTPVSFELRLQRAECGPVDGGLRLQGHVENIGERTFDEVAAVGVFTNAQGNPVARAIGALASGFAPGESRSFDVSVSDPQAFGCAITFYLPSGEKLSVDESVIP
jgi:hypothetical protein